MFSVFDLDLTFVGHVVSAGVSLLLWVQVAGPSTVDVTTMLLEALMVYLSVFNIYQS